MLEGWRTATTHRTPKEKEEASAMHPAGSCCRRDDGCVAANRYGTTDVVGRYLAEQPDLIA